MSIALPRYGRVPSTQCGVLRFDISKDIGTFEPRGRDRQKSMPSVVVQPEGWPDAGGSITCPAAIGSDSIHKPIVVSSIIKISSGSWLNAALRDDANTLSASRCARYTLTIW